MTISEFRLLQQHEMIQTLQDGGVYVGKRKQGRNCRLLFQFESFYVEILYFTYRKHIAEIITSASTHILDPYLEQINVEEVVE